MASKVKVAVLGVGSLGQHHARLYAELAAAGTVEFTGIYDAHAQEALKWFALVLMTLDHINKFLCAGALPFVFEAARLVMPLFAFILAYNMARPHSMARDVQLRTFGRLLAFGMLATPPFVVLVGWGPLNILFTLAFSVTGYALIGIWLLARRAPVMGESAIIVLAAAFYLIEAGVNERREHSLRKLVLKFAEQK